MLYRAVLGRNSCNQNSVLQFNQAASVKLTSGLYHGIGVYLGNTVLSEALSGDGEEKKKQSLKTDIHKRKSVHVVSPSKILLGWKDQFGSTICKMPWIELANSLAPHRRIFPQGMATREIMSTLHPISKECGPSF